MPKIGTTLNYNIGDLVNSWRIEREPERINRHYYCWCKCIICGKEKHVRVSDLNANTTNCRCQTKKREKPTKPQKLKTISFKDWCSQNERYDLMDRWDYNLNQYTPDIVACKSGYEIFFKCPEGKHKSKKVVLASVTNNGNKLECDECYLEENSFGVWCEKNKPYLLELWDCELNKVSPYEITYGTSKKYYFKCPRNLHESQLKSISKITGRGDDILCNKCNSIGQYIVDHYGSDALDLMWDYGENIYNPFEIAHCAKKHIYIKCMNEHNHPSYRISCPNFVKGRGCPVCKQEREESKLQEKVRKYIEGKYQCDIVHEYSCSLRAVNPKTNYVLPYDNEVLMPNGNNLIIEVHGIQHYEINSYIKLAAKKHNITPEQELAELQWRDEYKKQYALSQGYHYLAIPHWTESDESYKTLIDNKIQQILSTI